MKIIYSFHAGKRMKQRGVTELEIEQVLSCPDFIKNSLGIKEAFGKANTKLIIIFFIEEEILIRIITVII